MQTFRQLINLIETEVQAAPIDEFVFVYGSLKRGFANHYIIESARFIGTGLTPPRFDMLDLDFYPAAIRGKHVMTGEVYEVDAEVMAHLDQLENNGKLYLRQKVPVLVNGRQIPAWIYLYLRDDGMTDLVEPEGNQVTWKMPQHYQYEPEDDAAADETDVDRRWLDLDI